jgi:hypothetical protein
MDSPFFDGDANVVGVVSACTPSNSPKWSTDLSRLTGHARKLHEGFGLIRLSSIPRLFVDPITGKKPSPKSIYRWARGGLRGVVLETIRTPYGICTTQEFLEEFLDSLNDKSTLTPPTTCTRLTFAPSIEAARRAAHIIINRGGKGASNV